MRVFKNGLSLLKEQMTAEPQEDDDYYRGKTTTNARGGYPAMLVFSFAFFFVAMVHVIRRMYHLYASKSGSLKIEMGVTACFLVIMFVYPEIFRDLGNWVLDIFDIIYGFTRGTEIVESVLSVTILMGTLFSVFQVWQCAKTTGTLMFAFMIFSPFILGPLALPLIIFLPTLMGKAEKKTKKKR